MNYSAKILMIFLVAFIFSCNESTVNPSAKKEKETMNITKNVWVFNKSSNSKPPANTKIKFNDDGSYYFVNGLSWQGGSYNIDYDKNQIITFGDKWKDTSEIISVSDNKLVLKESVNGETSENSYIPETFQMQGITINGYIEYDTTVTDFTLKNVQVCILWHQKNNYQGNMTVYGIGEINSSNNTFSIHLDSNFSKALFVSTAFNINEYFNLGYICFICDQKLKNGQIVNNTIFNTPMVTFGCVEDRAILFINGNYKNWNYNNLLHGEFVQGFNLCKGWYTQEQTNYDGWEVDNSNAPIKLKVIPYFRNKSFKFPNW